MLLMDDVTQTIQQLLTSDIFKGQTEAANEFQGIYSSLKLCPRFVLDEAAATTMSEITLSRPKIFREVMNNLRIPYSTMWVEWLELHRETLRQKIGSGEISQARPLPIRVGFLIQCSDDTGRRGKVTWAWTTKMIGAHHPNIGAIAGYFNLDRNDLRSKYDPVEGEGSLSIAARLWADNPVQYAAMLSIWRTVEHKPSPWGKLFLQGFSQLGYMSTINDPLQMERHAYADVVGEYISMLATIILLTAQRTTITFEQSQDITALTRARIKKGKPPLLDHKIVHLYLNKVEKATNATGKSLDFRRKSPRVHLVSSYLAHRGDKHWLVSPYMRGKGEPVARTIYVHG